MATLGEMVAHVAPQMEIWCRRLHCGVAAAVAKATDNRASPEDCGGSKALGVRIAAAPAGSELKSSAPTTRSASAPRPLRDARR